MKTGYNVNQAEAHVLHANNQTKALSAGKFEEHIGKLYREPQPWASWVLNQELIMSQCECGNCTNTRNHTMPWATISGR
tara:strand:- start:726 stop:962 length:237 start_codon:yes stop_codon:yes gene_type:complete